MSKAKIKFICTLIIFGTVGIVSSFIPLSSTAIVFYRASLSAIFLIAVSLITKRKFDFINIKKNFLLLILAGIFMGLNWVFQFESFKVASVSVGTVCYNTMPIFVILLSPMIFKERLTFKSIFCVLLAMLGIVLVSNVIFVGVKSNEILGCFFGLLGALFYALTMMTTKKMTALDSYDKIIFEFIVATLMMLVYINITHGSLSFEEGISNDKMIVGIIMLLLLSFFHTGFAYIVYFDSVALIKAQEIAILTYIDPVVALILSAIILGEKLNIFQIIGAILILLSTLTNELWNLRKNKI